MTGSEALAAKGKLVRVSGYKPARIGTLRDFQWMGRPRKVMYGVIDFGRPMPDYPDGVMLYRVRHLSLAKGPEVELTPEEFVRGRFPDASCEVDYGRNSIPHMSCQRWVIWQVPDPGDGGGRPLDRNAPLSGRCKTRELAWKNAMERLKKADRMVG